MFLPNYRELIRFSDEKMVKINLFESHRMFADLYCLR
ncbi:MAG: cupin domain-containing protein, partial [Chlorobi bacterium CHB2]|nr:cupin domain-containing protein [Chlorobi bacterium CHB2]